MFFLCSEPSHDLPTILLEVKTKSSLWLAGSVPRDCSLTLAPTTLPLTHPPPATLASLLSFKHTQHVSAQVLSLAVPSTWVTLSSDSHIPSSLISFSSLLNIIFSSCLPLWLPCVNTQPLPNTLPCLSCFIFFIYLLPSKM